jgi:hypothetical protein
MNVTDTASAAASLLMDLQVGGTSQFRVSKGGAVTALGRATIDTLTIGRGGQTAVSQNTAFGFEALNSASLTANENTGVGYRCLQNLTTGTGNSAIGRHALKNVTTGITNTAVGMAALDAVVAGSSNTAVGLFALASMTANKNTAMGQSALSSATTSENNVAFGFEAGDAITTGARNTIIGANSDPSAAAGNDQTVVGEGLTGKGDNTAFIGGTNGAYNEKNVTTWETTSDARIKKNVADFNDGLAIIEALRVHTFEYRTPEEITEVPQFAAIDKPGVQIGVIAQEIQQVLPACVTTNSTGVLSVNTDPLVWHLINAVKELSAEIKALKGMRNA